MNAYKKCVDQLQVQTSRLYLDDFTIFEMGGDEPNIEDVKYLIEMRTKLVGNIEFTACVFDKTIQQIIKDIEKESHLKGIISEKWFQANN